MERGSYIEHVNKVKRIREWLESVRQINGSIVANTDNTLQALLASERKSLAEVGLKILEDEEG